MLLMKFNTLPFTRLNVFSPSYIAIDEGQITIVTDRYCEKVHANEIKFVDIDTPKIGFSRIDLVVEKPERKISIYGFTEQQCEEINIAINTYQIENFEFNPLKQYSN